MKLKTLIHRRIRKWFYRLVRYHWLTERFLGWKNSSGKLVLHEIGLEIDIRPGDLIVDCGANVGDLSSRFAATPARVIAFEASPVVFRVLQHRFSGHPRVECINKGVWDEQCKLGFSLPAKRGSSDDIDVSEGSSFLKSKHVIGQQVEIDCIDLPQWLLDQPSRIRLLKMDIEGAECRVIEAMLSKNVFDKIDFAVIETHEAQMPYLAEQTEAIRQELLRRGLADRIRLDWV